VDNLKILAIVSSTIDFVDITDLRCREISTSRKNYANYWPGFYEFVDWY